MFVWRVAVLAEDAFDEHAQVRADVLAHGPVDGCVGADGGHDLARDGAEGFVSEDLDGAVVGL